jgi:hypothetical protein
MRPGKRKGEKIESLQLGNADIQLNRMIASTRINGLEVLRPRSLPCPHLAHYHLCLSLPRPSQPQIQIEDHTAHSVLDRVKPPLPLV